MLNTKAMRRQFEAGYQDQRRTGSNPFWPNLIEALGTGQLRASEFSMRDLFDNFVEDGRELRETFNPRFRGAGVPLLEAGGPVSTANFSNIMGQIVYSRIMESYNSPVLIGNDLLENIPTEFDGEKVPGIGQIGDEAESIQEGKAYPMAGFAEEWVQTPETIKRGFIVGITKEAIFYDRTGLVLRRGSSVGTWLAVNKEKRMLDQILGVTTNYRRNGGAAVASYQTSQFTNLITGNPLVDWTSVQAALLLFDGLSDPNTGEPIIIMPDTLVVPTALLMTADAIVHATQVIRGASGGTSTTGTVAFSRNPLRNPLRVVSSQYVALRSGSSTNWWLGQSKAGYAYMENWPLTTQQAASNSEAEFTHDVVARFKVSERGATAALDPRYWVKSTP